MQKKKKQPSKTTSERLKIDGNWEDMAEKLLKVSAKSIPARQTKPRKKA